MSFGVTGCVEVEGYFGERVFERGMLRIWSVPILQLAT